MLNQEKLRDEWQNALRKYNVEPTNKAPDEFTRSEFMKEFGYPTKHTAKKALDVLIEQEVAEVRKVTSNLYYYRLKDKTQDFKRNTGEGQTVVDDGKECLIEDKTP